MPITRTKMERLWRVLHPPPYNGDILWNSTLSDHGCLKHNEQLPSKSDFYICVLSLGDRKLAVKEVSSIHWEEYQISKRYRIDVTYAEYLPLGESGKLAYLSWKHLCGKPTENSSIMFLSICFVQTIMSRLWYFFAREIQYALSGHMRSPLLAISSCLRRQPCIFLTNNTAHVKCAPSPGYAAINHQCWCHFGSLV